MIHNNAIDNLKTNLTPGSMLINTSNNQDYGVVVDHYSPKKIIVFRLDKNTYPVFSKTDILPNLQKVGNINEYKNSKLKSALLKYFHTNNLSSNEKTKLQKLMDFSFPLGIPAYQPDNPLSEEEQSHLNLNQDLVIGRKIYLNTPKDSVFNFLDNSLVNVIDRNEHGIWIVHPHNEEEAFYYLPYKNPSTPTFCGISRMSTLAEESEHFDNFFQKFKDLNKDKDLSSIMNYKDQKVKVNPITLRVIFPHKLQNLHFNPKIEKFEIHPDNIKDINHMKSKVIVDEPYEFEHPFDKGSDVTLLQEGGALEKLDKILQERDEEEILSDNTESDESDKEINIDMDIDIDKHKASQIIDQDVLDIIAMDKKKDLKSLDETKETDKNNESSNNDEESNKKEELLSNKTRNRNKKTSSSDNDDSTSFDSDVSSEYGDSEINESDLEDMEIISEDEVEDAGVFQKVRRVEVDDVEKVYKESIQKGDLFKYKLEKIPRLRRNDVSIINKLNKEINTISLLKHKITDTTDGSENQIKFVPADYKPLLDKYCKADFTNQLLIPIGFGKTAITVHKDAILKREGMSLVYLVIEDIVQIRPIKLGEAVGNRFIVIDGLQDNDQVVIKGNERLIPGQEVKIVNKK